MNLIAAVDRNWGIGKDGKLLVSIPEDMKFFKDTTLGKVVVMGRKTLESFPGKKPLKNRTNLILTRNPEYSVLGAKTFGNIVDLLEWVKKYEKEDVFVIGGGSIYKLLLPYCKKAFITHIDMEYESDTFFPNLSILDSWRKTWESDLRIWNDIPYKFCIYTRN